MVLGGGAAFGLANEVVLKLTETSQVPASAFDPLEFRHGPISVCEPGMLVVGILGGAAEAAERRVLEESAALGATTWMLGPDGPGCRPGRDRPTAARAARRSRRSPWASPSVAAAIRRRRAT